MNLKYTYNMDVFTNENDISYYILGAFITDGCIYKNGKNAYACQLSSCDQDWLTDIKNIIGYDLKLHQFTKNYCGIRIMRNEIAQWFIKHNCLPNKTYSISLPKIPDEYFADFLRGCIDGDGSIGTYISHNSTSRICTLISASKTFLQEIQSKLNDKQIKCSLINRGKKNGEINGQKITATVDSYCLKWTGKNCFNLLGFCYYDNHKLSLKRKLAKAQEIINFYNGPLVDSNLRKIRQLNINCKIQWPSDEELLNRINSSNVECVARELGVHGTAIRNRLKRRLIYNKIIK